MLLLVVVVVSIEGMKVDDVLRPRGHENVLDKSLSRLCNTQLAVCVNVHIMHLFMDSTKRDTDIRL